jgi:peptide/nickel transport system ATP-binding protein
MANSLPHNHSPVLEVQNLSVTYETEKGPLETVRNVSLKIHPGQIYGLVGESGSGKTTLARAVVRYLPGNGYINSGSVHLNGVDLGGLSPKEMRRLWGLRISMVHQDPAASVNPAIPVGEQVAEVARVHLGLSKTQARLKALEMLEQVQLPDPASIARRYPHQLSGGMLQRILIASALITNPQLLIMDEPTTALDVTTEAVILDLVGELLKDYQTAVLYITHHLGVVARICDRVGVMYAGELMEEGDISQVFKRQLHPYTLGLLNCVPRVDMSKQDIVLNNIPGQIPRPDSLPPGCIFSPRCQMAQQACRQQRPPLIEADAGHYTACLRWTEMDQTEPRSRCCPTAGCP